MVWGLSTLEHSDTPRRTIPQDCATDRYRHSCWRAIWTGRTVTPAQPAAPGNPGNLWDLDLGPGRGMKLDFHSAGTA